MKNLNALIFGATGGIGQAICQELCAQGFKCYLIGRFAEKLSQLKKKHQLTSDQICCTPTITTNADFEKTQSWLKQTGRTFSTAIHCSGYGLLKRASDISLNEWQLLMDANLTSAFSFYKLAWEFREASQLELVYFGSASIDQSWPKNSLYGASKAGLEIFARSLQKEIKPNGGRVWLYKPGSVRTGFFDQLPNHLPGDRMIDPIVLAKMVVLNLQVDQSVFFPELTVLSE